MDEQAEKLGRLERLRAAHGLDGILLARTENIAWAAGGARAHIVLAQETGVGALLYDGAGLRLITNTIEAGRLLDEEFSGSDWRPIVQPWHADWLADGVREAGLGAIGADVSYPGATDLGGAIADARTPLLPAECDRYRAIARETGQALEGAAREVRRGESEFEIAARIASQLTACGLDPIVVLVAVDDRINSVRHPLPTEKVLGERAMLVCCGRKHGLVASATRIIHFGAVPASLRERHAACARVDAAFLAATRPGATAGQILAAAAEAYAAEGYSGEWQHHHQGGAAGYAPRDWLATPNGAQSVHLSQAFAWNPSIAGTKVEDTVLLTEAGIEILTATGEWPTIEVRAGSITYARPEILERAI